MWLSSWYGQRAWTSAMERFRESKRMGVVNKCNHRSWDVLLCKGDERWAHCWRERWAELNVFKMRGIWVPLFVDGNESVKRRELMTQKMKGDNCSMMLLSQGEWLGSRVQAESPTLGRCWLVARRQMEDTCWADTSWSMCWWGSIPVFWVHLMLSEQGRELRAKSGRGVGVWRERRYEPEWGGAGLRGAAA